GPGRRADLAQPARRLRGGDAHHRAAPRPRRGRLRARHDDPAGGRARDHRRDSHQGRGDPGDDARAGLVSSEVDVAAPGIGLPEIAMAVGLCAALGGIQGSVVALVGVPSFVVTLAGLLIFQGVILQVLEVRGTILIQDQWINDTAYYYFAASAGWIIAALVT